MSILIKGMEMPKKCAGCMMWYLLPFKDTYVDICRVTGKKVYPYAVDESCPLIPVPDHGDLIDRDALEKDIDKYIGGEESRSRFHHWVQVQSVVIPGDKGEET